MTQTSVACALRSRIWKCDSEVVSMRAFTFSDGRSTVHSERTLQPGKHERSTWSELVASRLLEDDNETFSGSGAGARARSA